MKFFKKKDKRKGSGTSSLGLPGFAGGAKDLSSSHGNRQNSRQPFGSPPQSPYGASSDYHLYASNGFRSKPSPASAHVLADLPSPVLARIFSFVCPHARDETYETCEQSSIEDACMLCDLRDLAHCVQANKRWKTEARKTL